MKRVSGLLMLSGALLVGYAITADISVVGFGGGRVSNMGLMHDRLVNTILGGLILVCGILLRLFGSQVIQNSDGFLAEFENASSEKIRLVALYSFVLAIIFWAVFFGHIWRSPVALIVLSLVISYYLFRASDTAFAIKRLALIASVFSLALLCFHVLAVPFNFTGILTMMVIESIVDYLDTSSIFFGVLVFYVIPALLSLGLYFYFAKKNSKYKKIA